MAAKVNASVVDVLADLFRRAEAAAIAADPGPEQDGGTCNLDTPAFRIERCRAATIEAAATAAGVEVSEFNWFGGRRWYWLHVTTHGQGNRRSRMAEAAGKVLREFGESEAMPGFHACMYLQID